MNITGITVPVINLLSEYAPTIAAFFVTYYAYGKNAAKILRLRLFDLKAHPIWYLLVIAVPIVVQLLSISIFQITHFNGLTVTLQWPGLGLLLFSLVLAMVLSFGEEIGWRGFALPHLLDRFNGLLASIIIGFLWAFWHVPGDTTNLRLLTLPSTYLGFCWFALLTISGSVLMTWVYFYSKGNIPLMALLHTTFTVIEHFMKVIPFHVAQFGPAELTTLFYVALALICLVDTKVFFTPRNFTRAS